MPRNVSLNWFMPALVNSSVGSLCRTSDEEWTRLCPLDSKKRRKLSRMSAAVRMETMILSVSYQPRRHGAAERGFFVFSPERSEGSIWSAGCLIPQTPFSLEGANPPTLTKIQDG